MFGFAAWMTRMCGMLVGEPAPLPAKLLPAKRDLYVDVRLRGVDEAKAQIASLGMELASLRLVLDGVRADIAALVKRTDKPSIADVARFRNNGE